MRFASIWRLSLALVIIVASPVAVAAAIPASSLNSAYLQQCSAIVHHRWNDFNRSLAPSYVGKNLGGPSDSYSSEAKSISQMAEAIGLKACAVKIVSIKADKDLFTADVSFNLEGVAPKTTRKVNRGDRLEFDFHSVDTWQVRDGEYEQLAAVTQGITVRRNGNILIKRGSQ